MIDGEWYLLYVSSGHEEQARRNLEQRIKYMDVGDKIFDVVIPTAKEIEIKAGKRRPPCYPCYSGRAGSARFA